MMQDATSIQQWLGDVRGHSDLRMNRVSFDDCAQWRHHDGRFVHDTGRFFSVTGVGTSDVGLALHDQQLAMIDQPEVGWLGFVIRKSAQGIEWLAQAKTEPGNINQTHLAPSIQATRSNYQRQHGGRPTEFLNLFRGATTFISDAPHSEQGTRFLWKFNRNSILALPSGASLDLSHLQNWAWCSSSGMRDVLGQDYGVNTDARSVIASGPWSLLTDGEALFKAPVLAASYGEPGAVKNALKRVAPMLPARTPRWEAIKLQQLDGWSMDKDALRDRDGRDAVACFEIDVKGREVDNWCQPFLMQPDTVDHVLFMRLTENGAQFFVRVFQEIGFGPRKEYGPSLHGAFQTPDEMAGWGAGNCTELASIRQSDEGGRFMHADARYRIVLVNDAPPRVNYPFGQWINLGNLERLTTYSGATTNELRTLASVALSRGFDDACANF